MRRALLESLLTRAASREIDSLWLGRDLGYRGGRRTGLALTDDLHMTAHASRWELTAVRPTKGAPIGERTAAIVWKLLQRIDSPVFLWNVFPFHPHDAGAPFTNRSHTRSERLVGEAVLSELVDLLRPKRIIGLGIDAGSAATRMGPRESAFAVRHPSYGGQPQFVKQITALYELPQEQAELI
jgi:hypothetical protein